MILNGLGLWWLCSTTEPTIKPTIGSCLSAIRLVGNTACRQYGLSAIRPVGNTACRQYGLAGARHQAFDRHPQPYNIPGRESTAARDVKEPESTTTSDIKSTVDGHPQAAPAQDDDGVDWAAPGTALDAAPQDAFPESITDTPTTTPDTKSTASGDQLIKEAVPMSSAAPGATSHHDTSTTQDAPTAAPPIPNTSNALFTAPGESTAQVADAASPETATHAVPPKQLVTGAATETAVPVQVSDGAPPKPPPRAASAPRSELPQRPPDAEIHLIWNLFDDLPQAVEHRALAEMKAPKQFEDAAQAASWMRMRARIQHSDAHHIYCIRCIDAPRGPP